MAAVQSRRMVAGSVVLLAAHPDDEVLGASLLLQLIPELHLLHATDAAPVSHEDVKAVSRMRYAELKASLVELGVSLASHEVVALPDGKLIDHAGALVRALEPWVARADLIVTHAFEGGHPDHDSCALAAHLACRAEQHRSGRRVTHLEFPVYALSKSRVITNRFPADRQGRAITLTLSDAERDRKRAALSHFVSQRHVISRFPLDVESLAPCPAFSFDTPRARSRVLFARESAAAETVWREKAARVLESP